MQVYSSPSELWEVVARSGSGNAAADTPATEAQPPAGGSGPTWYKSAVEYWDKQEASNNGVLGGYGHVSDLDVRDSRAFLLKTLGQELQEAAEGKRQMVALGEQLYTYIFITSYYIGGYY